MNRLPLLIALMASTTALAGAPVSPTIAAAAERACTAQPEACDEVSARPYSRARNGSLRLIGVEANPKTAVIHLDLALHGGLSAEEAAAHAELAAAGLEDVALLDAALSVGGPEVRASLLAGLHRSESSGVSSVLAKGLSDGDPRVREVAVSVLGRRADAADQGAALAVATSDSDAKIRQLALRAVGWHNIASAAPAVQARMSDGDPLVRRAALQALQRIDPTQAATAASALSTDIDDRVRLAATQILAD